MCQLPSSSGTLISVSTKLRDSLSGLDIVWSDMFESEDSGIKSKECRKHEADFLKGAPPKWLHFYKPANSPFVERDCFKDVIQLVEKKREKKAQRKMLLTSAFFCWSWLQICSPQTLTFLKHLLVCIILQ